MPKIRFTHPFPEFQHHTPLEVTTPLQPRTTPTPTNANTFTTLINSLTHSLTTTSSPHLPTLSALLRTYPSNATHWSQFAHANPEKQYTRNLVCEVPGIFNLLLLVWTPGKASPIHDHADAHCLMKVCLPFPPFPIPSHHLTNKPPLGPKRQPPRATLCHPFLFRRRKEEVNANILSRIRDEQGDVYG